MRAICLKQVLCAANYSNTLAQKVAIGSFHSKYKNISKISQRRLTRECNTQTRTSKYKNQCWPEYWGIWRCWRVTSYITPRNLQQGFIFSMMKILIVHSSHLHPCLWICSTLPLTMNISQVDKHKQFSLIC